VILDAYAQLARTHPQWVYVYGETGWLRGGSFKPHRTHQNGLSVDFMVPVLRPDGTPSRIVTSPQARFGYGVDFNRGGEAQGLRIDFESMATHLAALQRSAKAQGAKVRRIFFAPDLQAHLRKTKAWPQIRALPLSKRRSWVRHDDHYHVDFQIPCEPS
jgi:penicillin-insensitive murein endopeptidase